MLDGVNMTDGVIAIMCGLEEHVPYAISLTEEVLNLMLMINSDVANVMVLDTHCKSHFLTLEIRWKLLEKLTSFLPVQSAIGTE
jgi:hypothetical protein